MGDANDRSSALLKIALGVPAALVLLTMLVFTAIPNIFFGFDSSPTQAIIDMTERAMSIGAEYMSIEDFEKSQMDAIVTSIAGDYENSGISIDAIEIKSSFSEDDLCWLIAINSVSHEQNLYSMSVEDIRALSLASLSYSSSLGSFLPGHGGATTLEVDFGGLDPYLLMERLGFEEEERSWASAMFELLSESGAIERYASEFEAYTPSYGGDLSYSGEAEYGGSYDGDIDISGFVSPGTKNNLDLAAYAVQAWENGWGYVWGTFGNVLTDSLFEYKLSQYPDGVGNYEDFIRENWLGRRTTDCAGLIKGYSWLDAETLTIDYAENGMPDFSADQLYSSASVKGSMDELPEIPGIALWKEGHIGVYIGGGEAIESMGTKYGVVKTEVAGRGWEGWCEIAFITYMEGG